MNDSQIAKHLIVISYDAFSEDNWDRAIKQPNLARLLQDGSYSTKLKSVYPSLTYVVHSTMVTGVYPDRHGIYHNNPFQPFVQEEDQRWFWFRRDINVPTIYDVAKRNKLKTAALLWPATGKATINHNIPEIRAIKNENQIIKSLMNGTPLYSIEMELKFGRDRNGINQPFLDDFTTKCAVETIKKYKPNLFMMHMIDLDDAKHEHGTDSIEVEQVIARMDRRIGDIIRAVDHAGIRKDTVFLVLGDHGQINVRYKVALNTLLKKNGLIYEEDGNLKWRAYFQNAGGSAYLHIKEGDEEAKRIALSILEDAMMDDRLGIEKIISRNELNDFHVIPWVQYMVEAKKGYSFEDNIDDPTVIDLWELGEQYATHGYLPTKPEYRCNLLMSGTGIKKGYNIGEVEMTDIAPTMAKILGLQFGQCDGHILDEIFDWRDF